MWPNGKAAVFGTVHKGSSPFTPGLFSRAERMRYFFVHIIIVVMLTFMELGYLDCFE